MEQLSLQQENKQFKSTKKALKSDQKIDRPLNISNSPQKDDSFIIKSPTTPVTANLHSQSFKQHQENGSTLNTLKQYSFEYQRLAVQTFLTMIEHDPKLALKKAAEAAKLVTGKQVVQILIKFYRKNSINRHTIDPNEKTDSNRLKAMELWTQLFLKSKVTQKIFAEMMAKVEQAVTRESTYHRLQLSQFIEAPHLSNHTFKFLTEAEIDQRQRKQTEDHRVQIQVGSLGIKIPNPKNSNKNNLTYQHEERLDTSLNTINDKLTKREQISQRKAISQDSKHHTLESHDDFGRIISEPDVETYEERKAKLDLIRGIIPIEYRDNIHLQRDEKAASGVAKEFQQILDGLDMFGLCVEDLESHILSKVDPQEHQDLVDQAAFVRDLRIQLKNQKGNIDEDRYSSVLKDLAEQQLMTESIPVVKLIDIVRRNGFYQRIESSTHMLLALENLISDARKAKDKVAQLQILLEHYQQANQESIFNLKNQKPSGNRLSSETSGVQSARTKGSQSQLLKDLISGKDVDRKLIIAELTELKEMLDQSENEREVTTNYFKKENESLNNSLRELQKQQQNTSQIQISQKNDQTSLYTQTFKQFQQQMEKNGQLRALDEINEQLFQRVLKEIDIPDASAGVKKTLSLFQNQSPSNLQDAQLLIGKLKTFFLNAISQPESTILKTSSNNSFQDYTMQEKLQTEQNNCQYLASQLIKLAKETKYFKEKLVKEMSASDFQVSQLKSILQEQPFIEYLIKTNNEFIQTNKDLQSIYDHLVADGYEQIEKIQSWMNKKYVKLQESHEIKYIIQTKQQKKETEMMEQATKKFKNLLSNKSTKSQQSKIQDSNNLDEEQNQILDDQEGLDNLQQALLNQQSISKASQQELQQAQLKIEDLKKQLQEVQSELINMKNNNTERNHAWSVSQQRIQELVILGAQLELKLNEKDFISAKTLSDSLNRLITHQTQTRPQTVDQSPFGLIFVQDQTSPQPFVSSSFIDSSNLEDLIRNAKKLQKINLEGGFQSIREPLSSRNAVYTKNQTQTKNIECQTSLDSIKLDQQLDFFELIAPYVQQLADIPFIGQQNSNQTLNNYVDGQLDFYVSNIVDQNGQSVDFKSFLSQILEFTVSKVKKLNSPILIDSFVLTLAQQGHQDIQIEQNKRSRFMSKLELQKDHFNSNDLIQQFIDLQFSNHDEELDQKLVKLNTTELEGFLVSLLQKSYYNPINTNQYSEADQKQQYISLPPNTSKDMVSPIIKPLNPKLSNNNRFSNASFTTNLTASKNLTSLSNNQNLSKNLITLRMKNADNLKWSATQLRENSNFIKAAKTPQMLRILSNSQFKGTNQVKSRVRIRTAITRNQSQLRHDELHSRLFKTRELESVVQIHTQGQQLNDALSPQQKYNNTNYQKFNMMERFNVNKVIEKAE